MTSRCRNDVSPVRSIHKNTAADEANTAASIVAAFGVGFTLHVAFTVYMAAKRRLRDLHSDVYVKPPSVMTGILIGLVINGAFLSFAFVAQRRRGGYDGYSVCVSGDYEDRHIKVSPRDEDTGSTCPLGYTQRGTERDSDMARLWILTAFITMCAAGFILAYLARNDIALSAILLKAIPSAVLILAAARHMYRRTLDHYEKRLYLHRDDRLVGHSNDDRHTVETVLCPK